MIRNQAGQSVGAQMVNATTGAAFAGAVTVYVTGDAGTQAIGTVGSGVATLEGNGYYTYLPSQGETDYAFVAYTFVGSGAIPQTIQFVTLTLATVATLAAGADPAAIATLQIITDALTEIGVLAEGETPDASMAALGLSKINRLLDNWNADRDAVYTNVFTQYTLTPSLSPHTIGPTGTCVVSKRPVTIDGAALVLTASTPDAQTPIRLRDAQWWQAQSIPALTSTIPTDLYYAPDWPNGSLYFWPVPTVAYPVVLMTRQLLAVLTLTTVFTLPQGYQDAVTLTLAESLAPAFGVQLDPQIGLSAQRARARIFENNRVVPTLTTRDAGMPGRSAGTFNYLSGQSS